MNDIPLLLINYSPLLIFPYIFIFYRFILLSYGKFSVYHLTNPSSSFYPLPSVSIVLPVLNGSLTIVDKLDNIFSSDYSGNIEIIVVDDGSIDNTNELVLNYPSDRVELISNLTRVGKSQSQNIGVKRACNDILVFTDLDAIFKKNTLFELVKVFSDSSIGCSTANLIFPSSTSILKKNFSSYWSFESNLRHLESLLGILCVAGGPLMSMRKSLWIPLNPRHGDDCVIPLYIALKGYKNYFCIDSIAYENSFSDPVKEFRARVRMTIRNLDGVFSFSGLLNPFKHPGYSFSLISHKLLRWFSPFFILGSYVLSVISVFLYDHLLSFIILSVVLFFMFVCSFISYYMHNSNILKPLVSVGNFSLSLLAFFIGSMKYMLGYRIEIYSNN
jgi:cellulose synthase/poly-beta-1,6-N-acetylglucosamine synthase-like glycosyltransferase